MDEHWKKKLGKLMSQAVNLEHSAFYFYLALGVHFDSRKVSLLNLSKFFFKESDDELEHAKIVIKYMNQIGVKVSLGPIEAKDPSHMSISEIFETAESFEYKVLQHYELISKEAAEANDNATSSFVDFFLDKQVKEVKSFHDHKMNSKRTENSLGEFLFDQSFKTKH